MPRPIKPIPRPCAGCGHQIKQKYFKKCGRCRARERKFKKEARALYNAIRTSNIRPKTY